VELVAGALVVFGVLFASRPSRPAPSQVAERALATAPLGPVSPA
jgi:hypothetical protein